MNNSGKKRSVQCKEDKEEVKDRAKAAEEAGWEAEAWGQVVTASALHVEPKRRTREEFPVTKEHALNVGPK